MPIKLIGTIILLILVTIFAGVNLDNKCDITFIFYTFKDIPVFMTVIISFAIGAVVMLPFTLGRKRKKNQKVEQKPQEQPVKATKEESKTLFDFKIKRDASPEKGEKPKKEKKSLFGRKSKKAEASKAEDSSKSENAAPAESATPASDDDSTGAPV